MGKHFYLMTIFCFLLFATIVLSVKEGGRLDNCEGRGHVKEGVRLDNWVLVRPFVVTLTPISQV
jgi:hypothetical protein